MNDFSFILKRKWDIKGAESKDERVLTLSQTSPGFMCLQCKSFENTMKKEKRLKTSNFSFSRNIFYPFRELFAIFKFRIVIWKLFQFGKVYNLSYGKELKIHVSGNE